MIRNHLFLAAALLLVLASPERALHLTVLLPLTLLAGCEGIGSLMRVPASPRRTPSRRRGA